MAAGRLHAVLFLLLVMVGIAASLLTRQTEPYVNPDMFALLPNVQQQPVLKRAITSMRTAMERHHLIMVSHEALDRTQNGARQIAQAMRESGYYSSVMADVSTEDFVPVGSYYFDRRYRFLDSATRDLLRRQADDELIERVVREMYSPLSRTSGTLLQADPFLLSFSLANRLGQGSSRFKPESGLLTARVDGKVHVLIVARLKADPFFVASERAFGKFHTALDDANSELMVQRAGVIEHAVSAVKTGQSEIRTVGVGSLVGILLLLLFTFRGVRPIVVMGATIGLAMAAGFAATRLVFGPVHLLALVGGGTLIGLSVDYGFHYMTDRFRPEDWSASQALVRIWPAARLGWLSSIVAFAGLYGTGFEGLQQISVFSIAGLSVAIGTVRWVYPQLFVQWHIAATPPLTMRLAEGWLGLWQGPRGRIVSLSFIGVILFIAALGIPKLQTDDNVLVLSSSDPQVLAEERAIQEIAASAIDSRFFLVRGPDSETVLTRQEALMEHLEQHKRDNTLSDYTMMASVAPSRARQDADFALVRQLQAGSPAPIEKLAARLGLVGDVSTRFRASIDEHVNTYIDVKTATDFPSAEALANLWIDDGENGMAGIVQLSGVRQPQSLAALASDIEGVSFVDPVNDLSAAFSRYRVAAGWLVMLAYLVVAVILGLSFNMKAVLRCLSVPFLASLCTLGILGVLGESLNLFHLVGLVLVLGMGMDYAVYFWASGRLAAPVALTVLLASCSTILAFGLLSLSQTGALHGFGLTVLVGIFTAFMLAPLAAWSRKPIGDTRL